MLWRHRRMISLLICNTAENKHCLTHLSQIMSFGGPSYRHWDLHLLHAQVLSYNNKSLLYKTLDTKKSYSTKSLATKRGQTASKTEVLAYSLLAPQHTLWFLERSAEETEVLYWLKWTGSVWLLELGLIRFTKEINVVDWVLLNSHGKMTTVKK